MADQLTCLLSGTTESQPVDDIVQPALQVLEEYFTGHALLAGGVLKLPPELPLQYSVHPFYLLFFAKLLSISDDLPSSEEAPSMFSGCVVSLFDRTLLRKTASPFQEQFHPLASAQPANRACVSCQDVSSKNEITGGHSVPSVRITKTCLQSPIEKMAILNERPHTRRFLGGRHPLWGIGVTSLIDFTSIPAACIDRIAASRPAPGPFTRTSQTRMPYWS